YDTGLLSMLSLLRCRRLPAICVGLRSCDEDSQLCHFVYFPAPLVLRPKILPPILLQRGHFALFVCARLLSFGLGFCSGPGRSNNLVRGCTSLAFDCRSRAVRGCANNR